MFINYAHRGASNYCPENTMSAFFTALPMGANGIETDIQRTKDDRLVLFHDDTVDRVTDFTGALSDFTYEELYEMFIYSPDRKSCDKIVLFEDFLRYFSFRDLNFAIELKQDFVEKETIELLEKYGVRDKTVLTSFNPENLERARRLDNRYKIGYLVEDVNDEVIRRLRDMNGEQICPHSRQTTPNNVKTWHDMGFSVRAWGVADPETMKRVYDAGADGMTVNFPDLLTEYMKVKQH